MLRYRYVSFMPVMSPVMTDDRVYEVQVCHRLRLRDGKTSSAIEINVLIRVCRKG